jgi:hypothetical protein
MVLTTIPRRLPTIAGQPLRRMHCNKSRKMIAYNIGA